MGCVGMGKMLYGSHLPHFLRMPEVQVVAVCDVDRTRREAGKKRVDDANQNSDCSAYLDYREMLTRDDIDAIVCATPDHWHALIILETCAAGKDMYCEKPCTKNISQSLLLAETMRRCGRVFQAGTQRRNLPHFAFACELARTGRLGKLQAVHAHPRGMSTKMSGWLPPEDAPPIEKVDWDMYLGPAAWRPFNKKMLNGFHFEKGGGFMGTFQEQGGFAGGGVLEWGSHCVDLCQWAADADDTAPIEYNPPRDERIEATYADGVKLILREDGWLPLGSCPVRFEGDDGWIETGDSGKFVLSSPELLAGRDVEQIGGYPATFHVRDFLDCVKTRSQPKANADVACFSHIACHAANIALFLDRQVQYDLAKHEFIDDEAANRLRSEASRAPWQV
ncbi:MAG: Gfo/Idh/MocA family protein [Planctomycetota bacterium]